jgi:hypothetical protein
MKQISQKKQPSNKILKKERISDQPKYEDKTWQVPKYGIEKSY